jgi:phage-related protein
MRLDLMSQIWDIEKVKPARFHPKARTAIQEFPEEVRRELGKAIFDLQKGEKIGMPLSRNMASVGRVLRS